MTIAAVKTSVSGKHVPVPPYRSDDFSYQLGKLTGSVEDLSKKVDEAKNERASALLETERRINARLEAENKQLREAYATLENKVDPVIKLVERAETAGRVALWLILAAAGLIMWILGIFEKIMGLFVK